MRLSISSIARRVAGEGGGEMRLLNRNGSTGALFLLSRLIRRTYACYNRVRAEGKDDSFPRFFQIKRCCMPGVITIIPLSLFLLRKIFQCKNITWLKIYGKITSKICLKTPGGDQGTNFTKSYLNLSYLYTNKPINQYFFLTVREVIDLLVSPCPGLKKTPLSSPNFFVPNSLHQLSFYPDPFFLVLFSVFNSFFPCYHLHCPVILIKNYLNLVIQD